MARSRCLTSARYSMRCDILKPAGAPVVNGQTEWEYRQDPDSGAIVKRWIDNPETPQNEFRGGQIIADVPVMARGVIDGGIRVAGTTERFDEIYQNVDWVKATFGKNTNITKRDRVTNIRTIRDGTVIWKEEEVSGAPATTFNVMGVTPVLDPFSNLIEFAVLLERAEVQGA